MRATYLAEQAEEKSRRRPLHLCGLLPSRRPAAGFATLDRQAIRRSSLLRAASSRLSRP